LVLFFKKELLVFIHFFDFGDGLGVTKKEAKKTFGIGSAVVIPGWSKTNGGLDRDAPWYSFFVLNNEDSYDAVAGRLIVRIRACVSGGTRIGW
jgi:hypothetical protein